MKKLASIFVALFLVSAWVPAVAGTPDGQTPAEEQSCLKYKGEGAREGLCIAYCEAQDCSGKLKYEDPSCDRIVENFIAYSLKKGYVQGPKLKGDRIDCKQTACTREDEAYCGGQEVSLQNPDTGECQAFCTASFEGLSDTGGKQLPICSKTKLPHWERCIIKEIP